MPHIGSGLRAGLHLEVTQQHHQLHQQIVTKLAALKATVAITRRSQTKQAAVTVSATSNSHCYAARPATASGWWTTSRRATAPRPCPLLKTSTLYRMLNAAGDFWWLPPASMNQAADWQPVTTAGNPKWCLSTPPTHWKGLLDCLWCWQMHGDCQYC